MASVLDPPAASPEIYRNSPFQYAVTAQAGVMTVVFTHPVAQSRNVPVRERTVTVPRVPSWLTPPPQQ